MIMDVAISSCGRIDVLEQTIDSFQRYIKFSGEFRFVILEDFLEGDDRKRASDRDVWLESHADWFDVVRFNDRKAGYVRAYGDILALLESPLFFRLDDDTPFLETTDIDPIAEYLGASDSVCHVGFRRQNHRLLEPNFFEIGNPPRKLTLNPFYSVSTGIHKLDWARKIVDKADGVCHETSVLTPIMLGFGQTAAIANGMAQPDAVDHVGTRLGYIKGTWK